MTGMNEQIKRYRYNHRSLQEHGRENVRISSRICGWGYVVSLHRTKRSPQNEDDD